MSEAIDPVEELVIDRFTTLYGPPTTDDQDRFVAEYHDALDGTDPAILRDAIGIAIRRQRVPAWPTVGECVDAVSSSAEQRAARNRKRGAEPEQSRPTPEQRSRVDAIVKACAARLRAATDEGKAAVDLPRTDRDAWDERMATSATARQLAGFRDDP